MARQDSARSWAEAKLKKVSTIEELRRVARRRVPKMFYDYVDAGSWTETTYRANESAFQDLSFRQRVAVNIDDRKLQSTLVGQPVNMPVALAPTGLTGMVYPDGEILAAKACERFGIPFTLSTMSICSIEDVAEHVSQPFWFQLYAMRDKGFVDRLVDRAKAAGCSALVVTLDLQLQGERHKDFKNGLSAPPRLTLKNLADLASKPRWCFGMLRTPRRQFRNILGHVDGVANMSSLAEWTAQQFDPKLTWNDVARIKDRWGGKLILKGILDPEDVEDAISVGADAIIVSNHGGRQLDGAEATIRALPKVVRAVGGRAEVHLDGGVRSGQDVLKAIALGARGVYLGRSYLYGLGAFGGDGVAKALQIIAKEMDLTMALCGRRDIQDVDGSILRRDTHNQGALGP